MIIIQNHLGVYKDEPNDNLAYSESFKSKVRTTGSTPNDGNTKDIEIIVPFFILYLKNCKLLFNNC